MLKLIVDGGGCTHWMLDIEQSQQLALSTLYMLR